VEKHEARAGIQHRAGLDGVPMFLTQLKEVEHRMHAQPLVRSAQLGSVRRLCPIVRGAARHREIRNINVLYA